MPKKLLNAKRLLLSYSNNNNVSIDSIKIVYFNDKYIFIKNRSEIEILDFKDFFDKNDTSP